MPIATGCAYIFDSHCQTIFKKNCSGIYTSPAVCECRSPRSYQPWTLFKPSGYKRYPRFICFLAQVAVRPSIVLHLLAICTSVKCPFYWAVQCFVIELHMVIVAYQHFVTCAANFFKRLHNISSCFCHKLLKSSTY